MPYVVVDTNVVSFISKRDTRARLFRRHLLGRTLLISFMTLAEVHAWALERRWGQARREQLAHHLERYAVHYPDSWLCERWAEVRHQIKRKGREIGIADGWIAATALYHSIPLVTHNPSDFADVSGLTLLRAAKV